MKPRAEASMRAVWCDSLSAAQGVSWPRETRTLTTSTWPREAARWRLELESPRGEVSGLWRSVGWDFRMRLTRRASLAWIARRMRRDGSILGAVD